MVTRRFWTQGIVTLFLLTGLLSCGGGGSSTPPPPPSGTQFWAADFTTMQYYKVYSSLVATGTHCYIYAENGSNISTVEANAVSDEFDNHIYSTITGKFGNEPKSVTNGGSGDADGDAKIYILLLNVKDGFNPAGGVYGYVAGYFMSTNEIAVADYSYSNAKEMFYMNVNPALNLQLTGTPTGFFTTLAHEFQHMIHWEQKTNKGYDDEVWLNEAMSEVAPTYLYGPNYDRVWDYEQAPSDSLTIWKNSIDDYGIAYMWSQYFKDRFDGSGNLFSTIMQQSSVGITSVNSALSTLGTGKTFASTFNDMAIAIFSGMSTTWPSHPEWSYTSIDTKAGTYDGVPLPGLTTASNRHLTTFTLPVLEPGSIGYSWYQPVSGATGTVTWTGSGATTAFIDYNYGAMTLYPDILSGSAHPYTDRGILIVSTPSTTATGGVVLGSPSAVVSMTPKEMLSNANVYAVKHNKHQGICVQSFFAEKEKELRAKGIRPNF